VSSGRCLVIENVCFMREAVVHYSTCFFPCSCSQFNTICPQFPFNSPQNVDPRRIPVTQHHQ
jgi:hypothetical protein